MSKRLHNLSKFNLPTISESLLILFILAVGLIALNLPKPAKKHIVSEQQYYSQKKSVVINKPAVTTGKPPKVNVTPSNNPVPPIVGGLAPVISTIPTQEPVVFLGIDDGANKQQFELTMMQQNNIKASLFLANIFIKDNPQFFTQFQAEGSVIEDHTLNHPIPFNQLNYSQQVSEICGQSCGAMDCEGKRWLNAISNWKRSSPGGHCTYAFSTGISIRLASLYQRPERGRFTY